MKMELFAITVMIALVVSITFAYAQDEGTPPKNITELSCELDPISGLLCSNSELDLCVLRTDVPDVGEGTTWKVMDPVLCEAE